jgi:drug/metabolite transporter (DMT)-like permease
LKPWQRRSRQAALFKSGNPGFVALFSQFLGFFAWNRGLALGGIARVGQRQLLQPFVTLVVSALLLSEQVGWIEIVFALAVVASVMAGRRTQIGLKTPVAARSGPAA